jgi:mannose-6-phosphate isomerase-like protein (cupin superfamily)
MGRKNWLFAAALGAVLGVASGAAAENDAFLYVPGASAQADVAKTTDGLAFKVYAERNGYSQQMSARDKSGQVEFHAHWTDHFAILSGEATLTVGGTAIGMKDTAPDEKRGIRIVGGKTMALHPGDMVIIPAGMPHWFQLAPGKKIVYFAIKTRA